MMDIGTLAPNRRQFVAGAAAAAGGLLLDVSFPLVSRAAGTTPTTVTAWVSIGSDETVKILVGSAEMGQGVLTALPQILADELMVNWNRVQTEHAPPDPTYANPVYHSQLTAGSMSVRGYFQAMLVAGATAREMLVAAAAAKLGVSPSDCIVDKGVVTDTTSGNTATYGEVAADAAALPPPSNPKILSKSQGYRLVGKRLKRKDIPLKVNGSALYGIDAQVPGMVHAVVKHCPILGGKLGSTPATPPGALGVVALDNAVAVVAEDTWAALIGAAQLQVNWDIPSSSKQLDSSVISHQAARLLKKGKAAVAESKGDAEAGLSSARKVVSQTYTVPYLPHACMEPLNCTVSIGASSCEIWVPTQAPGSVQAVAAALTGLPASSITVNSLFLGGGLGRKFETDYVTQAVKVAQAIGKPVKLTWRREEDFANDQYRPMAVANVKVGLGSGGRVNAWVNRIVSPSILYQRGWIPGDAVDGQATEGATDLPYRFKTRHVEYVRHPAAIPVGFWRSVGHSINAFVVESAIDEAALAANRDPLAFRQKLLKGNARALAVLNAAAKLGRWGKRIGKKRARGIAFAKSFGSLTAQVVEIERISPASDAKPRIRVVKVSCAVDCGMAVNPDQVEAQVQGGIVHGLNAAQWGEIRFDNGRSQNNNFDNFPMMRLADMPKVSVQIVNTPDAPLGGVGEIGVPAAAPALANAYAALTGIRLRSLPLKISTATRGED